MLTGGMVGGSRTRYLPFGAYRTAPTQPYTDRGFTGQKHNDDLGLIYYNARYYIAGIARFASADVVVPNPTNPQNYNRFSYVLNNPLRFTDPSGHICYDPGSDAATPGNCDGGSTMKPANPLIINPRNYEIVILVGLNTLPRVNDDLSRIGIIAVNYRDNYGTLGRQFPGAPRSAVIVYRAPVATLIDRASGANVPYDRSSWDTVSESDLLARIIAAEAAGTGAARQTEMVGVAQVVMRRVTMPGWGASLREVVLADNQFAFTLSAPEQVRESRFAAEAYSNPLVPRIRATYEESLAVAVGVARQWLYDPRTALRTEFRGRCEPTGCYTVWLPDYAQFTDYPQVRPVR